LAELSLELFGKQIFDDESPTRVPFICWVQIDCEWVIDWDNVYLLIFCLGRYPVGDDSPCSATNSHHEIEARIVCFSSVAVCFDVADNSLIYFGGINVRPVTNWINLYRGSLLSLFIRYLPDKLRQSIHCKARLAI